MELYDFGPPLESASPASNALLFEAQNIAATHPGQSMAQQPIRLDVNTRSKRVDSRFRVIGASGEMQINSRRSHHQCMSDVVANLSKPLLSWHAQLPPGAWGLW